MKKSILSCLLLSTILLASCNNTNNSDSVSNSENSNSSEDIVDEDGLIYRDNIFTGQTIELSINDDIFINNLLSDSYKNGFVDVYIDDKNVAKFEIKEIDDNEYAFIKGLKTGTTHAQIVVDETYKDDVTISITEENAMNGEFKTGVNNLFRKTFTVLGDSTSDITVTAYPYNRPTFWSEQLVNNYYMKLHNHAISGSTASHSIGLLNNGAPEQNVGTSIIRQMNTNHQTVKADIVESDYCFIYYGNNDYSYKVPIGEIGEIDDNNFTTKESFKGSMSYIIDKVREYNPTIKIVLLSLSYSTWTWNYPIDFNALNPTNPKGYAQTREELHNVVEEIAIAKKCKYIDIYNLWNQSNYSTYCPDGIHPQTAGYELIVEKIINS